MQFQEKLWVVSENTTAPAESSHTQMDVNGGASEALRKAPQPLCKPESERTIAKFRARKR